MPEHQEWLEDDILATVWTAPLSVNDLRICFHKLADTLDETDRTVHILFDITQAGHIPAEAPVLALNTQFLQRKNIGRVAVVGMDVVPQILARVAAKVSGTNITFFPYRDAALTYLKG